jgi:hypothetical protein
MRSWLSLLALLLAVAGLAAWLLAEPEQTRDKTYAASSLKPADVTRVTLARRVAAPGREPSMDQVVIEKRDGQWRITSPIEVRAEASTIERLLAVLEARSTVRYPASDLGRYGLDAPLASLTANGSTIAYGSINPTTREQYLLADNHVLVVPLAYAAALPRTIDALLSKALFADDEKQPVRFDLTDFTVALEEGTWAVAPIVNEASADERNAWVDAWRNASALTVSRGAGPNTSSDAGKSSPSETSGERSSPSERVKISLKDGRVITLTVAQRTPDVVLVRHDDGVAYHFFAEAGRRLLAPPGAR